VVAETVAVDGREEQQSTRSFVAAFTTSSSFALDPFHFPIYTCTEKPTAW
jgi:hypothetical protein